MELKRVRHPARAAATRSVCSRPFSRIAEPRIFTQVKLALVHGGVDEKSRIRLSLYVSEFILELLLGVVAALQEGGTFIL